jgi:hypothetical protein
MAIDRSDFLILATTLAAGGAGGYVFRDRAPGPQPASAPPPAAAPSNLPPPWPSAVSVVDSRTASAPVCDDAQGTPEQCPSVGPSDEGICPDVILKRCQEFKLAFKPRVAALAVACLRALKGGERCDPARINQCGHMALVAACPEPAPSLKGQLSSADSKDAPSVTLAADSSVPATSVGTACENIQKNCASAPIAPTLADCKQTLAGLNDLGRANMLDCASAHCNDRGLYACEAVPKAPGSR